MAPSTRGRAKKSQCPMCMKPYRSEKMVECTNCKAWCCYECVNVSDEVATNKNWKCPQCETQAQGEMIRKQLNGRNIITNDGSPVTKINSKENSKTASLATGKKSSRTNDSRVQLKLKLLQEERELLRQERELARETRRLLEEESTDSQEISDTEVEQNDGLANELLSLQLENYSDRLRNNLKSQKNNSALKLQKNYLEFEEPELTANKGEISGQGLFEANILSPKQCAMRKTISHDLPIFNGNPYDWPLFISSYERSTDVCGFDNNENLIRLQKCLRGAAKNAVSSFLILPECVPQIISTLKVLFGRPEQIIETYINEIRRQAPPKPEKLETFVEFALAVKNLCFSLKAANLNDYLTNPTLMHELLAKLPCQMKINWAMHRASSPNGTGLLEFADWLFTMATNVCITLPTLSIQPSQPGQKGHVTFHSTERREKNENGVREVINCKICNKNCKNASECQEFKSFSCKEKWEKVRFFNLCRLCLKRHRFPCKYPVKCDINGCQRKHHPLLHQEENKDRVPQENVELQQVSVSKQVNSTQCEQNIRFRIIPVILQNGLKQVKTFAFLDEGSSVTLLEKKLSQELDLDGDEDNLCLQWTSDVKRVENNSKKVLFSIQGDFKGSKQYENRSARTVSELNLPRQTLNAYELKQNVPYLTNLPFRSYENANPQILIGLDNWDLALPLKVKEGESIGQPIAAKCRLGWTVFALLPRFSLTNYNYHMCQCNDSEISNETLQRSVKEYFSVESLGVRPLNSIVSKEIERAGKIQQSTLTYENNTYKIGLLWKYEHIRLPDSKSMAIQRLECLEKRIKYNPELGIKINQQIEDFIQKKYIRKLSQEEINKNHENVWYLPIFPVFNPNKPDKFRLVWDAAATVQGISLNSILLKGDDQLASLLGVLLRFRERKVGFTADIKEMFLRVGIIDKDQQAQRFLWRGGNPENSLDIYVMTVMTFGATCSPSNAQFVKNTNANKFINNYPRAVQSITENHYVDDLLDSADTEEEAIKIAQEVTMIHSKANFEIRNWHSNSKLLCNTMNHGQENDVKINLNFEKQESTEKVLGMWWNTEKDAFVYSLKFNKGNKDILNGIKKPTKREILRILMSIYDPLGLLSHFLIYLKILLQEIWRISNITWDQTINEDLFKKWLVWLNQLPNIENISVPRCYLKNIRNWNDTTVQMHIFTDASQHASAAVAYIRIKNYEEVECVLLAAKTRVAPIKLQTIPRLELEAAVMGARLAKTLAQHLLIKITETFYWSDSIIVLNWLKTEDPRKLTKFVAYRVAEIQENSMSANWRYIPTKLNVADEATKWKNKPSLNITDRWFKGPEFLYQEKELWPYDELNNEEIEKECVMQHNINIKPLIKIQNFSKYTRLLRSVAYVYRFINILRAKLKKQIIPRGNLTSEELLLARNVLIKLTQKEFYEEEIKDLKKTKDIVEPYVKKSSSLYKLSPYLDNYGLLRIRGRLDAATCILSDTKRPVILPRESHLTKLILENYHNAYHHQNHETVINEIRQTFYIPRLRRVLNKVRGNCAMCKIKCALPVPPEMSPLPECRVAAYTPPFTFTGVDYFGPINVAVGRRLEKRWGVLFTCLTTRCIHLEVAYKLDADSCILCFQNFMSRRGRPRHIYCDRGTNFIATERILRESLKDFDKEKIAEAFISPEITFHFNTPLAPHMAGVWERLVKTVKTSLYAALPSRNPTDSLLQSCLIATENIVNSRPLTYLPLDTEESEALTPNHFLLGSSSGDKPIGDFNDECTTLKFNYLYREQFANKCWRRFVSEYVPKLLLRSKWYEQKNPIKEGDIVIICDKDLPRNNWPKGRVIEVKRAPDGQVRKAKVQTIHGIYERPVVKLAVISVEKEKESSASEDCAEPGGSMKNGKA